ncbi:MAG TPA: septum site-determining protein MinC [Firmicutes bacterium]|jgi:septum site-determining protein MinC|nr:septum site-determining protein MinC [Bacillota bacterium]
MLLSATKSLLSDQLVFKGLKQGLTLFIPEEKSFAHWLEILDLQLKQAKNFFQGGAILVEIGERKLSPSEHGDLKRLLAKYRMTIKSFNPLEKKRFNPWPREIQKKEKQAEVLFFKGTVRSGQRLENDGHIVIKGDVNPGGEVVASGDIIILGALRGIAHAGARGNLQAEIIALTISPVQLRIAHIFSRTPEGREERQGPEIAHIKGEKIVVQRL